MSCTPSLSQIETSLPITNSENNLKQLRARFDKLLNEIE